jgi:hypothetical protein
VVLATGRLAKNDKGRSSVNVVLDKKQLRAVVVDMIEIHSEFKVFIWDRSLTRSYIFPGSD